MIRFILFLALHMICAFINAIVLMSLLSSGLDEFTPGSAVAITAYITLNLAVSLRAIFAEPGK